MSTQLAPLVGPEAAQSIIRIQKAKIKDYQLICEFTEQRDQDAPPRSFTLTSLELVHPDLQHRFSRLVPHLCLLCEQLPETPDFWPQDEAEELPYHFDNFTVTGLSIGHSGGGVTLIGRRRLSGNRVLNLTSPYVAYEDENTEYGYVRALESAVLDALEEVEAALRGKHSDAGKQLDLFEQESPEDAHQLLAEANAYLTEPQPTTDEAAAGEQPQPTVKKRSRAKKAE
ncbi:hypothetical protein HNQ93_002497 [Hymenobacter luteus]|uniref:Uncharacterized protein n=2 Tax=Hymenobacter TaxID=89966 RepID=A0A7W9T115_9BACT|nr:MULTISPECIES: hypothetical protein [Hymenobacter]MBB4601934.1 hypothetical protein [Hymenobacter latericoloratus]MBB6059637.1 hypothetical protein [Hymenobacter luteus]